MVIDLRKVAERSGSESSRLVCSPGAWRQTWQRVARPHEASTGTTSAGRVRQHHLRARLAPRLLVWEQQIFHLGPFESSSVEKHIRTAVRVTPPAPERSCPRVGGCQPPTPAALSDGPVSREPGRLASLLPGHASWAPRVRPGPLPQAGGAPGRGGTASRGAAVGGLHQLAGGILGDYLACRLCHCTVKIQSSFVTTKL